jgi:hypothetical protein
MVMGFDPSVTLHISPPPLNCSVFLVILVFPNAPECFFFHCFCMQRLLLKVLLCNIQANHHKVVCISGVYIWCISTFVHQDPRQGSMQCSFWLGQSICCALCCGSTTGDKCNVFFKASSIMLAILKLILKVVCVQ